MKCLRPRVIHLQDGRTIATLCNQCRECDKDKQRAVIGRCMGEAKHAVATSYLTFTYGHSKLIKDNAHPHAHILVYEDVQRWAKRARKAGHKFRYVVAGEYGDRNARAHWHMLVFWQSAPPELIWNGGPKDNLLYMQQKRKKYDEQCEKRDVDRCGYRAWLKYCGVPAKERTAIVNEEYPKLARKAWIELDWDPEKKNYNSYRDPFWREEYLNPAWSDQVDGHVPKRLSKTIGHVNYGQLNWQTVRYVAKYCTKARGDDGHRQQSLFRMSKKPIIGAAYFDDLASRNVAQELPIRDRLYKVDGVACPKTGKPWRYYMNDTALKYYIRSFLRQWEAKHPGRHEPQSILVNNFRQKNDVVGDVLPELRFDKYEKVWRPNVYPNGERWKSTEPYPFEFSERMNVYYTDDPDQGRLYFTYDADGYRGWSSTICTPSEAAQRRKARRDQGGLVAQWPAAGPRPRVAQNADGWTGLVRLGKQKGSGKSVSRKAVPPVAPAATPPPAPVSVPGPAPCRRPVVLVDFRGGRAASKLSAIQVGGSPPAPGRR